MSLNKNLQKAKRQKNDEFYTQLSDIEKELRHYTRHFEGKVVYCNCDDPRISNFFHYFSYNFERFGLKRLERVNTNGPEHGILPRIVLDAESGGKSESWNSPSLNLNGSRRCCRGSAET